MSRQRDIFPLPPPHPGAGVLCKAMHPSKCIRRRSRAATGCWQQMANDTSACLNSLSNSRVPSWSWSLGCPGPSPTELQQTVLNYVSDQCRGMGKPPMNLHPVGAFNELCGSRSPYAITSDGGPAPYSAESLALSGARPSLDLHHGLGDVHRELLTD